MFLYQHLAVEGRQVAEPVHGETVPGRARGAIPNEWLQTLQNVPELSVCDQVRKGQIMDVAG
jgi:hypothetical protein